MKRAVILVLMLFSFPAWAQGAIPITADTAADVVVLGVWGPGRAVDAAFSPNSKLLAVGTTTGVHVFETGAFDDGDLMTPSRRFSAGSVAFLADNSTVMSTSIGYNIQAYDTSTGDVIYDTYPELGAVLGSAAVAPDGITAAITAGENLHVYDVASSSLLVQLPGHIDTISEVAYSADSSRIVTGSQDMTLNIWDVAAGAHVITLTGHTAEITGVGFTPDGAQVVSTSLDGTIRVWDVATGAQVADIVPTGQPLTAGAISPDGAVAAIADESGSVLLIDLATAEVRTALGEGGLPVIDLAYSPNGLLLSGVRPDRVQLWDLVGPSEIGVAAYEAAFLELAVSDDGSTIAAGGAGGLTVVFGDDGSVRTTITAPAPPVTGLAFEHAAPLLYIGSTDSGVTGVSLNTGDAVSYLQSTSATVAMTMHPTQPILNAVAGDGALIWWDTLTGEELGSTYSHEAPPTATAFSPDGQFMASADASGEIFLWLVETGDFVDTLDGAGTGIVSLAFSRSSDMLIAGLDNGTAAVWLLSQPDQVAFMLGMFFNIVTAIEFSPDNTVIAAASLDGTVRLFDTAGEQLLIFYDHNSAVHDLAFSPDGTRLYSVGADGRVFVWGVFE